jgi:hypothetical protein
VNAIHLLDPPDSSVNILATQEFSWEKSFTGFHRLQISEVNTFDSKTQSYDLTDTFKTVTGLKPYFTYYWRVLNIHNDTAIGGSAIWKFTTGYINSVADNSPENGFNISPNPVIDFLEISVGANGCSPLQSDVRIYDVFGQIVSTVNPTPTLPASREGVRIDVSGLAPGMYFVRIGDRVGKFVKI